MARRNSSQFSRLLKRLIGKDARKLSRRDASSSKRSLRAEQLETRRVFAGVVFDSLILANSDTGSVYSNAVAVDLAGNTYMGGNFIGEVDFDRNSTRPGNTDVLIAKGAGDGFIAKYGANNELIWAQQFGGDSSNSGDDQLMTLAVDSSGSIYIGGKFAGIADFGATTLFGMGSTDSFVAKLDSDGEFMWTNGWGTGSTELVEDLVIDASGNVTTAGRISGLGAPQPGIPDSAPQIRQYGSEGALNWSSEFELGGRGGANSILQSADGVLHVGGSFRNSVDLDPGPGVNMVSGSANLNAFVINLASDGTLLSSTQLISDTSVYPNSSANLTLSNFDGLGRPVLTGSYSGQINIAGKTNSNSLFPVSSSNHTFFATTEPTGNISEVVSYDWIVSSFGAIAPTSTGYLVAANFYNTLSLAPGLSFTAQGTYDIALIELNHAFEIKSASTITGTGYDLVNGVEVDGSGGIYLTGWSSQSPTVDYDPNPFTDFIVSNLNAADAYILKLNEIRPGDANVLFNDSFEVGEWNGLWVQDNQNDWFRSSQRSTSGSFAAEVDGSATNATLTTANVIDLSGMASATLTFDWLIESGFDSGEYLSLDISSDGGSSWLQDVRRLNGNVSTEDVWHNETVDLAPYSSAELKVRFRSKVSASDEDANVDNVRIVGIADGPNTVPVAVVGGSYSVNEGSSVVLSGAGSSDPDGSIASYAWDFDNDGQYDDASGVNVNFSTTASGLHTVGLQVTDNRGATAVTSTTVSVNNVAPTANAGSDINGYVGTPVSLSAAGSSDPGNDIVSYAWDLDNDGQYDDASGVNASFSAAANGTYLVSVLVTDADGATSTDSATITLSTVTVSSTKFYVVNDGSPDRTYEYGATGSAIESYAIDSGNSRPRGAASNAAGDTVWVADKNRKIYVYDTSGGLSGSWTAGTLASTAAVEGIATDGTDVWIVDSKSDKVFRYAGAATRTSGSQSAVSSFSLNSGNRSPKGIVTDGSYFWIVDSNTSDKVFKYSTSGSLVGSWTIDAANSSPTGLTIDPTGASQSIWIVDSGTDKVYEYANALGKTSGSLSAATTFSLAAGNTNPQGIADPPPVASPVIATRLAAVPTASAMITPINGDQQKSPVASEALDARLDLQPAAAQKNAQRQQVDVRVQAERFKVSEVEDREDSFFLDDSVELVDDALLSLLAQR